MSKARSIIGSLFGLAVSFGSMTSVYADVVWAIRPEPGLTCMAVSEAGIQILEFPRPDSPRIATAGAIVFAFQPQRIVNGYTEIQRPNRQAGWIQQASVSAGPAACVPSLMSNGLILMGTR